MYKAFLAVVPFLFVAACASTGNRATAPAVAAKGGAQYCMKDRLQPAGDQLLCNWAPTAADACEAVNLTGMAKGALAGEPANAGRCGNGKWLVVVNTK